MQARIKKKNLACETKILFSDAEHSVSIFSVAGHWLFAGRRWLDPNITEDLLLIESRFSILCDEYPTKTWDVWPLLLVALNKISTEWQPRLPRDVRAQCRDVERISSDRLRRKYGSKVAGYYSQF